MLRIQTTADYTPQDALTHAITDLLAELSLFEERFRVSALSFYELYLITYQLYEIFCGDLFQDAIKEKKEGLD